MSHLDLVHILKRNYDEIARDTKKGEYIFHFMTLVVFSIVLCFIVRNDTISNSIMLREHLIWWLL